MVNNLRLINLFKSLSNLRIFDGLSCCRRLVRYGGRSDWDTSAIVVRIEILPVLSWRLTLVLIIRLGALLSQSFVATMMDLIDQVKMILHLLIFDLLHEVGPTSRALFTVMKCKEHATSWSNSGRPSLIR